MTKSAVSRILWIGRATVFLVGLAVILALVFGLASAAFGADGKPFILGKATNAATKVTGLIGKVATGSTLVVKNPSGGSALDLQVNGGQAPLKVNPEAGTATNLSADRLDGKDSAEFAPDANQDGKADVAESADEAMSATNARSAANANRLDGKDSTDFVRAYERTVLVSPVSGDPAASGTGLRDALSGITDASKSNPYLLKIEPGVYEMGANPLVMKPWVDIEGSGEATTTIARSGGGGDNSTLMGADNAELRFLTVENTGEDTEIAIYNDNASPRLTHITATASGSNINLGVRNESSSPTMTDVTAKASGGGQSYGVHNTHSSPVIRDSTLEASGANPNTWALTSHNSGTVRVDGSRLVAPNDTTGHTVHNGAGVTTMVGASQLEGGTVLNHGTLTCAGVYDESYAFFDTTCP